MRGMKSWGTLLIVLGLIGIVCSLAMPITAPNSDIINEGRLSDRLLVLIFSVSVFLSGIVLLGFGSIHEVLLHPDRVKKEEERKAVERERHRQQELERGRQAAARQAKFDDGVAIFAKQTKKVGVAAWSVAWSSLIRLPGRFDGTLARASGSENMLIYRFLQILCYLIIPASVAIALLMVR
jgi:hypothetical protein